MKGLPFAVTCGPLLAQAIREAARDPRRQSTCSCCGARIQIKPDHGDQTVRCDACLRVQRVVIAEELPWRLTAASAEALRRTGRWARSL